MFCPLYTYCYCDHTAPHSSPTRRSSDLTKEELASFGEPDFVIINAGAFPANKLTTGMGSTTSIDLSIEDKQLIILGTEYADRKSTRLNSSHLVISYAVFCLKKKTKSIDN